MNNIDDTVAKELLEVQRTLGWMDLVIGSIDDAVYVTDADSHIVFVNQYFSDLLNIPRVFLLGQHLSDVFDIKLNKKLSAELAHSNALANDDSAVFNWSVHNKKYIFKISKKQIQTTKQIVYLAKDITREQELSNMKSSFINLASHQLRTPMTSVMLHSHMLNDLFENDTTDSRQKTLAAAISKSADRMILLINDILNITKIQNEALYKSNYEPVDIKDFFDCIYEDIEDKITAKRLVYDVNIAESLTKLECDRSALHEIVSNLITNAIQYTPVEGAISINVRTNGQLFEIVVKDTGIGIPKDAVSQIYDQFSRADNAFETFNEGTGLGLYLVKLLLIKIEGTIECKSKLNVGTTFTVRMPYTS